MPSYEFIGWCTVCLVGAPFAWMVQRYLGWCTSCSGKRQSRAETSAPPKMLLNEYLLNLAVSRANYVQTLLELRKLNAVN